MNKEDTNIYQKNAVSERENLDEKEDEIDKEKKNNDEIDIKKIENINIPINNKKKAILDLIIILIINLLIIKQKKKKMHPEINQQLNSKTILHSRIIYQRIKIWQAKM